MNMVVFPNRKSQKNVNFVIVVILVTNIINCSFVISLKGLIIAYSFIFSGAVVAQW